MNASTSLQELARRNVIPLTTTIEITSKCNLRCRHCYVDKSRPSKLSVATLARLFDELAQAGGMYLGLTGGEIATRRDLREIIQEARRQRFAVALLSSGTLWTRTDWDWLAQSGVSKVRMSLYAASAAVHDSITRVRGSHRKTLAAARGLLSRGVYVELACPVTAWNIGSASSVVETARKIGAIALVDFSLTIPEERTQHLRGMLPSRAQYAALLTDPRFPQDQIPISSSKSSKRRSAVAATTRPCRVGEASMFIRCNGDALPCADWPVSSGNVLRNPVQQIFKEGAVFAKCRTLRYASLGPCAKCEVGTFCTPCPATALRENGILSQPAEHRCRLTAQIAAVRGTPGSIVQR